MCWRAGRARSSGAACGLHARYWIERLEQRVLLTGLSIAQENQLPGSPRYQWDLNGHFDSSIEGFATDISVNEDQTVSFKINDIAAAPYHIDIYRMGFYGGLGARLVTTIPSSQTIDTVQPPPMTDPSTNLVDCGNWSVSASWSVPADATSGVYLAKLIRDDTGGASHVPFVVRDDSSHSDILYQTSDATWEAYNRYGGASLYFGPAPTGRAYKVSYNRPFENRQVAGSPVNNQLFYAEYPMIRFLEGNGYDVTYTTDVDSARSGPLLLNHKVFLSSGHDEYWSAEQRLNVLAARNAGVNLAFFTGNEMFWKTRWEPSIDGSGTPYRTLVCYKETQWKIDPASTWTGLWRDPRWSPPADGGWPENALTGTSFAVGLGANPVGSPIVVPYSDSHLRFWRNTAVANLSPGQSASIGSAVLGYEWDTDSDNGFRPPGLFDLSSTTQYARSTAALSQGVATHNLTLYRAASGALVFSTGTIQWAWGLDSVHDGLTAATDPTIRQATVNILADMGVQPATLQSDLIAASASADTTSPSSSLAAPADGSTAPSGTPLTITGTATDPGGGVVAGVEVSTDGGSTWDPASGTANWSYTFSPGATGPISIMSRAVDDSGNLETPSAGIRVTVTPPVGSLTLFAPTLSPAVGLVSGAAEVGLRFTSDISGYITALRFYKLPGESGQHIGHLWSSSGTLLGTAPFNSETPSGWQQASLAIPVPITAGVTYVASYFAPSGYPAQSGYYSGGPIGNGPLHAPGDRPPDHTSNGVIYVGASGFPFAPGYGQNFWVDVVLSAAPLAVVSYTPAAGSTLDAPPVLSATFNEPIQANSLSFTLATSAGSSVPAAASYDASSQTATLVPSMPLAPATAFIATVNNAQDLNGHSLTAAFSWSFNTLGAVPYTLFSSSSAPTVASSPDPTPIEAGIRFSVDYSGVITGIRFYKGLTNTGTHIGHLWSSDGTLLATATFSNESASGWQEADFASPVAVLAGATYVASYYSNAGHTVADSGYFFTAGISRGPLHVAADSTAAPSGVIAIGGSAFPMRWDQAINRWVDVIFSPSMPISASAAAPPVTASGATTYSFTVTYTDLAPIGVTTLGSGNLLISGPGGFTASAALVSVDGPNGSPRSATYQFTPPGGSWAAADNGTYHISLVAGQVRDISGGVAQSMPIGSFTVTVPPDITGTVSLDPGASGGPATGLAGWTVYLDSNNNGTLDPGEPSTTTDANGNYAFVNLSPGLYQVRVVTPAGYRRTFPMADSYSISLGPDQDSGQNNFSFSILTPSSESVSGTVFNDANHNGVFDAGEQPMAGVGVYLDLNNDGILDSGDLTTTTDARGNYSFSGLADGQYVIRQVLPPGFQPTTPVSGAATVQLADGQAVTASLLGDVDEYTVTLDFNFALSLIQNYGRPATFMQGDLNGDGLVNFGDVLLLVQNYGHTLPRPAASTVAWPSSIDLAAINALDPAASVQNSDPRRARYAKHARFKPWLVRDLR